MTMLINVTVRCALDGVRPFVSALFAYTVMSNAPMKAMNGLVSQAVSGSMAAATSSATVVTTAVARATTASENFMKRP